MYHMILNLLFGCRHRRITRPITAAHKASEKPGMTYVACLDCGQQFHYDLATMSMGTLIAKASKPAGDRHFQAPN
jgi:hypothetical protein